MKTVRLLCLGVPLLIAIAAGGAQAQSSWNSIAVSWTTPGDDSLTGLASQFDLRYSLSPINAANFASATRWTSMPTPAAPGTRQGVTVTGLAPSTTYYFAIKTADEVPNWSLISNVISRATTAVPDSGAPAPPTGLTAAQSGASVQLHWNANREPNLAGYSVYRATAAGGPLQKLNAALIVATGFLDSNLPANATTLWYEASASNTSGLESPTSAAVRIDLASAQPTATWSVSAGYPNPSASSQAVCIPITIPAAGPGNAVVDILDEAGHLVRHLALAGATTCSAGGGVTWDGRNDAGRSVVPGVYSVLLIAAGEPRGQTRLVREP